MAYDLILKNGRIVDPGQNLNGITDIAFKDGRVAAVGENLDTAEMPSVIDCTDRIISAGWVDLHVHVFWGCSHYGIEADPHCAAKGVTTALDAGSAGADTFPGFRRYVMEASRTRLFAFLHISSQGLLNGRIGELESIQYADVSRAVEMIEAHRDLILGVKVRLTNTFVQPSAGLQPLHLARQAADAVGLPLMVHPQEAWCGSIDDILPVMGKGDIITHCFHGRTCGILDEKGEIRQSVREALDRGVLLDVGHGRASFCWSVAERALERGVLPRSISSDLHVYSVDGPVFDMATTASKFLYLGMSLEDVVARITVFPAQILRKTNEIGTLKTGSAGDAVVSRLETGSFDFIDSHGQKRTGNERIVPDLVIRCGKVYGKKKRPSYVS